MAGKESDKEKKDDEVKVEKKKTVAKKKKEKSAGKGEDYVAPEDDVVIVETKKKTPAKKKAATKKKSRKEDEEEEEEEEERAPAKKAKGGAKKSKKASFLSAGQLEALEAARERLDAMKAPEVKELLRRNGQKVGGTKTELVERAAQAAALGTVPVCSSCGGGKLNFDLKSGSYHCPGYFDDTDFVRCGSRYSFDEVIRGAWNE